MFDHLYTIVELISRAGGGGSGSGGSGGSGSGGLLSWLLYLIFYYPTYKISDTLRQRLDFYVAAIISCATATIYSGLTLFIITKISDSYFIPTAAVVSLWIGVAVGLGGIRQHLKNKIKSARLRHQQALIKDPSWAENELIERATSVFYQYQLDWTNFDVSKMSTYMHPAYAHHMMLIMQALQERGRRNVLTNIQIRSIDIVQVHDKNGSENDIFSVLVIAKADDKLIELSTNKVIHRDTTEFGEIWNFVRKNSHWILLDITQVTEESSLVSNEIKSFAVHNGFYYSADWGSLLLPRRGQLFRKGSFKKSDINNHVIGNYHNILFELYNYHTKSNLFTSIFPQSHFLIAQATLPKSYGKIIVQKRQKWWYLSKTYPIPKGLQIISMEGISFDRRYQVFAETKEQVTSFELLDPRLMERLIELPYEINIEVVDNVLYLYTAAGISYQELFTIFRWAFKNMKL